MELVYHRSPKKFYRFDISNVSNKISRQNSGWGLYFSNTIPNKEYGEYLYRISLFKDNKNYVLIDANNQVHENIVNKIVNALDEHNKKYDEVVEFSYNGFLFYRTLSRILGGNKMASLFLLENGINGLKRNLAKNLYDYILFSDNDINIEEIIYDPY